MLLKFVVNHDDDEQYHNLNDEKGSGGSLEVSMTLMKNITMEAIVSWMLGH